MLQDHAKHVRKRGKHEMLVPRTQSSMCPSYASVPHALFHIDNMSSTYLGRRTSVAVVDKVYAILSRTVAFQQHVVPLDVPTPMDKPTRLNVVQYRELHVALSLDARTHAPSA